MTDTAPRPDGPLLRRTTADPSTSLLITGLASAAVLRADGELRAPRETRGGTVEWGGVYAQGVRLTGPWTMTGEIAGASYDLPSTLRSLSAERWRVDSAHRWGSALVRQRIECLASEPGVARSLELSAAVPLPVRIRQRIQPFLAPVLAEGIKPYVYRIRRRGLGLEARAYGSLGVLSPSIPASQWRIDGHDWTGGEVQAEVNCIEVVHDLTAGPTPTRLTWLAWGGVGASVDRATAVEETAIGHPEEWSDRSERVWSDWRGRAPTMEFPDAPELTQAYALARDALRALYTQPDEGITGLVAGFPWYPTLWCRDLAWMLPAVLWLGDRPWVEASIRTAFRFQATERIPLLGAEVGEIPMQISPGPAFLYGTSDTTLYYPDLVRRWLDHGGPIDGGRSVWPHLLAIAGWAAAKTDPRSGLFTNGGEVDEIRAATAQIGSIHYGFDAVDTTIWDSTDRRDHAIDVQVLYVSALRALAELGTRLGVSSDLPGAGAQANRVAGAIASSYAWRDEGYLYDSLRKGGTPEQKVRPNALRAVSAGLLDPDTGLAIVRRAARDDLTTPWGLRTLSARAPTYSPTAYHDGQVWTIATAWAAESALAVGEPELALRYLQIIAGHIVAENGLANECYRGDRDEPFDSCFLLGFSVAPFLTVLFERLWGLVLRADRRELAVRPTFPKGWAVARLRHLAVADGYVDLDWSPEGLEVRWTGPGRLTTTYAASTIVLDGPGTGRLDAAPP